MSRPFVVAIDGPAASGKGTLARLIAERYGLAYLDTGSLYRKVAYLVLQSGGEPGDEADALAAARRVGGLEVEDSALRTAEVGAASSVVSAFEPVRAALRDYQRGFALAPQRDGQAAAGAVLDGRDIGTVIFPDAPVKFFVTASLEERARRRYAEFTAKGREIAFESVLADLAARDERDASRASSPMKPAADAHLLDTTKLSIEAAFEAACAVIGQHLNEAAS